MAEKNYSLSYNRHRYSFVFSRSRSSTLQIQLPLFSEANSTIFKHQIFIDSFEYKKQSIYLFISLYFDINNQTFIVAVDATSTTNSPSHKDADKPTTAAFRSVKKILLWNIPRSVSYPQVLDPSRCGSCNIIDDREMAAESDAIVLHYHEPANLPPENTRLILLHHVKLEN